MLTDLYHIISDRYEYDVNCSRFRFKLSDLTEAIYGIAQVVDNMENEYENLEYSLDTDARYYIRLFPTPLDEYLNDTRRNIIEEFNSFISNVNWLSFEEYTSDTSMNQLPLLNELKIPEDLI